MCDEGYLFSTGADTVLARTHDILLNGGLYSARRHTFQSWEVGAYIYLEVSVVRLRLVAVVMALFISVGGILVFVLFGSSVIGTSPSATIADADNPITRENAQPGTASWVIPAGKVATTQIEAYASATYVAPGDLSTFMSVHRWMECVTE